MKPPTDRLSQRETSAGMVTNVIAGSFGMMWFGMTQAMPLTMFMECLGASGFLNGLVTTVQQLAMCLQVPAALVAERVVNRKRFWAPIALIHRVVWFLPALLPFLVARGSAAGPLVVLGVVALSAFLANTVTATWWSWMADLIPERIRGRFWGTRQGFTMLAYLASTAIAGHLLDVFPDPRTEGGSFLGFSIVFGAGALLGCLDVTVHMRVPERRIARPPAGGTFAARLAEVFRNRDFMWLTGAMGAWSFAIGLTGTFGVLYLTRAFHVSYTHLAATTIAASVGTVVAGFAWGKVIDQIGARSFGIAMMIASPLFGLTWFFMRDAQVALALPAGLAVTLPQPVLLLLVVNLFAGATYSAVSLCQISLLGALSSPANRTLAMSVHWSIVGLLAALGPVAGGAVVDALARHPVGWVLPGGTPFAFQHLLVVLHAGVVLGVGVPLFVRLGIRRGDMPVRILVGNPLRAIGIIQNIGTLSAADTSHERARAVRELGLKRTEFAVTDLIKKLDDPSTEVREEAVEALGHIGSREAIEALLAKLEDPDSDLGAQVARALRQSRDPGAVDALVRRLPAADREMAAETARTLGEIGDPRASPSLLDLLQQTEDARVVGESSQALARLGELAAIYEILPRMKSTRNPVLKRSLAVAVGDLLGPPGSFYRTLTREEAEPGGEAERVIDHMRRTLEELTRDRLPAEGRTLMAKCDELTAAYQGGDIARAANLLFDLAIGITAIRYGIAFGGDARSFVNDLIWRDERFGIGVWFINLLRSPWTAAYLGKPDTLDILLGIHFLSGALPKPPPGLFAIR